MTGKTISHYKIIEKLGQGGMGVVYKAQDTKLKRLVALKFLHSQSFQDQAKKTRLLQEAQAAAAINHPNVCMVYEIDEIDNQTFIVMEYIEGMTLKDIVEAHGDVPLQIKDVIEYATQIAQGLQAIHENDMVHRDIKSENILITNKDQVKIMDFGLVKLIREKEQLTQSGTTLGTVVYMSPELARGEAVDNRSDIWSFGVLLYEMITGKLPFKGDYGVAVIYSILNDTYESVTTIRSDVPQYLENIVCQALVKDPKDRYQDVGDILTDLKKSSETVKPKTDDEQTIGEKTKPSIAVLPFINMSADPEQDYFCDGITEEIINALTHIGSLYVVARTSAFFFKSKDIKLRDIGKELNVETVLEGSVRKSGKRLRITAQLINVANDYHIWSEKYDREMEDIFEVQDEISLAIAEALKIRLLNEEKEAVVKRHTEDHEAFALYLKGNYFWNQRTEEGYHKAIDFFQKAIEKDPNYARAFAGIAKCYIALSLYFMDPNVTVIKAEKAAQKALEIDDTIGEVHAVLSGTLLYRWNWSDVEKYCKRAIALGPQDTYAYHVYSNVLALIGEHEKAIAVIKQALDLDPLSLNLNSVAGFLLLFARRFDEAIEKFHKILEIDPNFQHSLMYLGITYMAKDMIEEAINTFQKFYSLSEGSPIACGLLGYAYTRAVKKEKALNMLAHLDSISNKKYVSPIHRALIYMGLGEYDQTFEHLEKAYAKQELLLCFYQIGFVFKPISADPRYKSLMKKMNM